MPIFSTHFILKDDVVHWVLEFLKPSSLENRKGMFQELTCATLKLGDRVRRGPHWSFGDQDAHLAGTVVGQQNDGNLSRNLRITHFNHALTSFLY